MDRSDRPCVLRDLNKRGKYEYGIPRIRMPMLCTSAEDWMACPCGFVVGPFLNMRRLSTLTMIISGFSQWNSMCT